MFICWWFTTLGTGINPFSFWSLSCWNLGSLTGTELNSLLRYSILTPYYNEAVFYSEDELYKENEDGISILFYLKMIYPGDICCSTIYLILTIFGWERERETYFCCCSTDQWRNFEERIGDIDGKEKMELTRQWVSYRGQTLSRTGLDIVSSKSNMHRSWLLLLTCFFWIPVRGMMYYRSALELQCFQDIAKDEG